MFMNFLSQLISVFGRVWSWFFTLLDSMGGRAVFISVFLAVFTLNKFIDLVIMQFLFSPTNAGLGQSEAKFNAIKDRIGD